MWFGLLVAAAVILPFCWAVCAWADDAVTYHVDAALGPETDDEPRDWFAAGGDSA